MAETDLFAPLKTIEWVDRVTLAANDYNPNKVSVENLKLLTRSILTNGWTMPIVARPDGTIIDGFHRWTIAGPEWDYVVKSDREGKINPAFFGKTLFELFGGRVPRVIVDHADEAEDMYGTITHNRARGTHLLEPMKAIVKKLLNDGRSVNEISKQLGMKPEEVFRLSDFTKEDFLVIMTKGVTGYSKAEALAKV